jgi:hypothetical protein
VFSGHPSLTSAIGHFPVDRVVPYFYIFKTAAYVKELPDDGLTQPVEAPRIFPGQYPWVIGRDDGLFPDLSLRAF